MHDRSILRVVQFSNATVRAGAEEVALGLYRGLNPERFRTYLVCPPPLLEAFGESSREGRAWGLDLQNPWQWPENRKFLKFLKTERIDILHAHMTRAALATVPLARMAKVPVVVQTCHGREGWRRSWASRQYWVDRRLAKWTDATIAVSESTKGYLITEKKLDPNRIVVIHNGRNLNGSQPEPVNLERLRAKLGLVTGKPVVGVFARLEEQKGHRFLLDALPAVQDRVGAFTVLLVGDGRLRPAMEKRAEELGIRKSVEFMGYRQDAIQLMALCDLVVLSSLYEGMPLVPIEAAALGKAVVATSVEGTCEVVVDGLTGILVPPRDPVALADGIIRLILNPCLRNEMGERARSRARELFSEERHLRETAACYESLLERRFHSGWKKAA